MGIFDVVVWIPEGRSVDKLGLSVGLCDGVPDVRVGCPVGAILGLSVGLRDGVPDVRVGCPVGTN